MAYYGWNVIMQNGIMVSGNMITIHGKEIPPCPKQRENVRVVVEDEHIYMNGYEWCGDRWKRTWKAFWKCYF